MEAASGSGNSVKEIIVTQLEKKGQFKTAVYKFLRSYHINRQLKKLRNMILIDTIEDINTKVILKMFFNTKPGREYLLKNLSCYEFCYDIIYNMKLKVNVEVLKRLLALSPTLEWKEKVRRTFICDRKNFRWILIQLMEESLDNIRYHRTYYLFRYAVLRRCEPLKEIMGEIYDFKKQWEKGELEKIYYKKSPFETLV